MRSSTKKLVRTGAAAAGAASILAAGAAAILAAGPISAAGAATIPAAGGATAARPNPDPESIARSYFEMVREHDFAAVASLMHPETLRQMRDDVRTILAGADVPRYRPSAALWDRSYFAELFGVTDSTGFQRFSPEEVFVHLAGKFLAWHDDVLRNASFAMLGSAARADDPDVVFVRYCISRPRPAVGYEDTPDFHCDDFDFGRCDNLWDLECEPVLHPFWVEHEYLILRNHEGAWRIQRAGFAHDALDVVFGMRENCRCEDEASGPIR